jgi:hypothetical protein
MYYDEIILNEEEIKEAIRQAKIKKYFHEKNKDYWARQAKPQRSSPESPKETHQVNYR